MVALASGVFAADPAVFVGFLQIGPVDIHKKRRLAGELSGFSPKKASNSPCFVDAGATTPGQNAFVDFGHVKTQLPIARVLEHLNLTRKLQGAGAQKRCACPIHCPHSHGRTFSVNLDDNVFQCFSPRCQKKGDVIDLWAALHHQDLRQAALDLVRTFALEAAPTQATERRNG